MAKGLGFKDYLKAAFSAKPAGMPIAPNWAMVAGFAMLGIANPGFLVIGAGVELAYLLGLSTNPRFQKWVHAIRLSQEQKGWHVKLGEMIEKLWPDARKRFYRLQERCESVLEFYGQFLNVTPDITVHHSQSLNKFVWIFLQLLLTKQAIARIVKETTYVNQLKQDLDAVNRQIEDANISPDLKKSLESKRDIIRQRLEVLGQAEEKLRFIDAELDRIEQQVELIREQAVISKDSQGLSTRIDLVSTSLGNTTDWIKEQQNLFGSVQDMVEEPPQILAAPVTERQ